MRADADDDANVKNESSDETETPRYKLRASGYTVIMLASYIAS